MSDGALLRPATPEDAGPIAAVWNVAWHDGHDGHVPEALSRVRTPHSFGERAAARIDRSTVAVWEREIVGFVTVTGNELEQLFVARAARGTGVATRLLRAGEDALAQAGHRNAWLAVVTGNARARSFYERWGWRDGGAWDYEASSAVGPVLVPSRRYVKTLAL